MSETEQMIANALPVEPVVMSSLGKPNEKKFPTFLEYIESLKQFYTRSSPFIYFSIRHLSPSQIQLVKGYYERVDHDDEDSKYLVEFAKSRHFIFSKKELDTEKPLSRQARYIRIDTEHYKVNELTKLPYFVYDRRV